MKTGALLGMLFCVIVIAQAQQPIREGVYSVDGIEYLITEPSSYQTMLILRNQEVKLPENPEYAEFPEGGRISLEYAMTEVTNEDGYKQIVRNVLGTAKVQALKNAGEKLSLNFDLTPAGEILDLYFVVKSGTLLTLEDISAVDLALRENYRATFKSYYNLHRYLNYISTGGDVKF